MMVKLAASSGELHPWLFLDGIEMGTGRDPVAHEGLADIFRG